MRQLAEKRLGILKMNALNYLSYKIATDTLINKLLPGVPSDVRAKAIRFLINELIKDKRMSNTTFGGSGEIAGAGFSVGATKMQVKWVAHPWMIWPIRLLLEIASKNL